MRCGTSWRAPGTAAFDPERTLCKPYSITSSARASKGPKDLDQLSALAPAVAALGLAPPSWRWARRNDHTAAQPWSAASQWLGLPLPWPGGPGLGVPPCSAQVLEPAPS